MSTIYPRARRRQKYGARKVGGFDSQLERAVYELLLLREKSGEISDIKRQQTIELQSGKRIKRITLRIDFTCVESKTNSLLAVEAKGFSTAVWKLKLKLWREKMPMPLEIWGGSYSKPYLVEKIE